MPPGTPRGMTPSKGEREGEREAQREDLQSDLLRARSLLPAACGGGGQMMAIINSVISRSSLLHLRGNLVLNYPSSRDSGERMRRTTAGIGLRSPLKRRGEFAVLQCPSDATMIMMMRMRMYKRNCERERRADDGSSEMNRLSTLRVNNHNGWGGEKASSDLRL